MRSLIATTLIALTTVSVPPTWQEDARPLFDGRTLAGWDGDPRFWSVEDGTIVGRSTEEVPCEQSTYLVWRGGEARDFELSFSFRIDGGNSGLQLRSREVERWQVAGYQADIEDGDSWTGCLYEQDGRGVVATRGERVSFAGDGARTVERFGDARELLAHFRRGAWNDYRVVARGERVTLELNGAVTCELVDRDSARASRSGLFALQLHAGPQMTVRFRDLLLRELDDASEPEGSSAAPTAKVARVPQWIWARPDPPAGDVAFFQKRFELAAPLSEATLTASCDNRMEVFLNGRSVATGSEWERPVRVDVSDHMAQGANLIAVRGENEGGPAALQLELSLGFVGGGRERIITDATWLATLDQLNGWQRELGDEAAWSPATVLGPLGVAPWGTLGPPEGELPELELAPGFRAELLYSVPRATEGSWVSLAPDGEGRLYASAEDGPLFRITPPPLDHAELPCAVERVEVELGDAQGLLWAFDSLYVVVNGRHQPNGLYRVTDADGDDRLDSVRLLKSFDGGGEHGPHAVLLGPSGADLYVLAGNFTKLPEGAPLRNWAEDLLLPQLSDPNGHDVGILAPGGWVCRTDPDGREWDVFSWGLRNAYDAAFDPDGELFTFDSDMEWDIGLPWYRPTRVLHLVQDGEYGWRNGSGKWPEHYVDSLPAVIDMGIGSPTGVVFGRGARFPQRYAEALFIADWAYGTIHAVHLEPRGASYGASSEVFVRGRPLPVTDLVIARDGALYFTVGGRGTQSGLYRVTYDGVIEQAVERTPGPAEREAARARGIRALLESMRALAGADVVDLAWPLLDHRDRFLRYAARVTVERAAPELWMERALAEQRPRALVGAMVALAHEGEPEALPRMIGRLGSLAFDELDEATQLGVLRAYALALIRLGPPDAEVGRLAADRFALLFPSGRPALDRELAALLAHLEDPRVIGGALELLTSAATQEEAIHCAFVLRNLRAGWSPEERSAYESWLDETAPALRGGASFAKFLEAIRADARRGLEPGEIGTLRELPAAGAGDGLEALDLGGRAERRWSVAELEGRLGDVRRGRSFRTGAAAYQATTCHTCHRLAGEGGNTGPDLTGAGGRFGARDLLEAILEPSAVISDQYRDTEIVTRDEELLVGRVESELDGVLRLRTLPPEEETVEIAASAIAERRWHSLSRMPAGLVDRLGEEELLDLLAFVLAGGDARDPAFRD